MSTTLTECQELMDTLKRKLAVYDDLLASLRALVAGFTPDPGTSDLYNEQPIYLSVPLGEWRKARIAVYRAERGQQ